MTRPWCLCKIFREATSFWSTSHGVRCCRWLVDHLAAENRWKAISIWCWSAVACMNGNWKLLMCSKIWIVSWIVLWVVDTNGQLYQSKEYHSRNLNSQLKSYPMVTYVFDIEFLIPLSIQVHVFLLGDELFQDSTFLDLVSWMYLKYCFNAGQKLYHCHCTILTGRCHAN